MKPERFKIGAPLAHMTRDTFETTYAPAQIKTAEFIYGPLPLDAGTYGVEDGMHVKIFNLVKGDGHGQSVRTEA